MLQLPTPAHFPPPHLSKSEINHLNQPRKDLLRSCLHNIVREWECECVSVWPRQLDTYIRWSRLQISPRNRNLRSLQTGRELTDTHTILHMPRVPHMCARRALHYGGRTASLCVRDQSRKWIFRFHVVTIAPQNIRFAVSLEKVLLCYCYVARGPPFWRHGLIFHCVTKCRLLTISTCTRVHINKTVHVLTEPVKRDRPTGRSRFFFFTFVLFLET